MKTFSVYLEQISQICRENRTRKAKMTVMNLVIREYKNTTKVFINFLKKSFQTRFKLIYNSFCRRESPLMKVFKMSVVVKMNQAMIWINLGNLQKENHFLVEVVILKRNLMTRRGTQKTIEKKVLRAVNQTLHLNKKAEFLTVVLVVKDQISMKNRVKSKTCQKSILKQKDKEILNYKKWAYLLTNKPKFSK